MRNPFPVVVMAGFLAVAWPATAASPGDDITVNVERDGNTFSVAVDMVVAAGADETWEVLTDFDKMSQILSNVDASKVVARDGNLIRVSQQSHAQVGLLRLSLKNVREIELTPNREIHSKLLEGDLKSSDFTTRISPDGANTHVSVRGTFVTKGAGSAVVNVDAVAKQTRRQYEELREEILRRKGHLPPPPCLLAKTCDQQQGTG